MGGKQSCPKTKCTESICTDINLNYSKLPNIQSLHNDGITIVYPNETIKRFTKFNLNGEIISSSLNTKLILLIYTGNTEIININVNFNDVPPDVNGYYRYTFNDFIFNLEDGKEFKMFYKLYNTPLDDLDITNIKLTFI